MSANHVVDEASVPKTDTPEQLNLFTDYAALQAQKEEETATLDKEKKIQTAMLAIQKKYGKNAILKGNSLEDGATARERNGLIGGHKS